MNTYNLTTVEEAIIIAGCITTTFNTLPIDGNGNAVTDYTHKFRAIKDGQMIVFDTEQEYRDWLTQNT